MYYIDSPRLRNSRESRNSLYVRKAAVGGCPTRDVAARVRRRVSARHKDVPAKGYLATEVARTAPKEEAEVPEKE
jgi:hypothetical protein